MKKAYFLLTLLLLTLPNINYGQSERDMIELVDLFCDKYFSECFLGRQFDETYSARLVEQGDNSVKIKGRLGYYNLLGIPQATSYEMEVLLNQKRVYFKKRSLEPDGNWSWEYCSKRFE